MVIEKNGADPPIPEHLQPAVVAVHSQLRQWGIDPHSPTPLEKPSRFRNNFHNLFAELLNFQPSNESFSYLVQLERKFPGLMAKFVQENSLLLAQMRSIYEVMFFVEDPVRDEVIRLINARDFEAAEAFARASGNDLLHFHIHSRLTPLLIQAAQSMENLGITLDQIQGFR